MADYNKLTVVQIKEEFKTRGIPTTGLTRKQQLIDRLVQDDDTKADQTNAPKASPDQSSAKGEIPHKADDVGVTPNVDISLGRPQVEIAQPGDQLVAKEETLDQQMKDVSADPNTTTSEIQEPTDKPQPTIEDPVPTVDVRKADEPAPIEVSSEQVQENTDTRVMRNGHSAENEHLSEPAATSALPSRQTSPVGADVSLKRKRRSLTPPISAEDAARKKLRQQDVNVVHLKEDLPSQDIAHVADAPTATSALHPEPQKDAITPSHAPATAHMTDIDGVLDVADGPDAQESVADALDHANQETTENAHAKVSNEQMQLEEQRDGPSDEVQQEQMQMEDATQAEGKVDRAPDILMRHDEMVDNADTARQPNTKDQRFKALFASPEAGLDGAMDYMHDTPLDRTIAPALHPATTALYIRNFMRPLHPSTLREHLLTLSQKSATEKSIDTIKEFFLDAIKTHCFAVFESVSAAARVRSALHDTVWPAERDRKPLWADFIPEEKVQDWIDLESSTGGRGRGSSAKRWEVVYEQSPDDGTMIAILQDSASINGPRHTTAANTATSFPPPEVQPLRSPQKEPQPASFLALDSLFRSTVAKPKLYFLPVSKERVDNRLDELDKRTSRRWQGEVGAGAGDIRARGGDEMKRYTFEEGDILVDNGPEFGLRRGWVTRGGYAGLEGEGRGRGSGRGSYSRYREGRGGGGGFVNGGRGGYGGRGRDYDRDRDVDMNR